MFKAISSSVNFSKEEETILEYWKEHKTFEKSLEKNSKDNHYVFYDGPPFATGTPHYGHLLAGTIKDVVPRYQTMKGKYVPRVFGWDCHGLPIEALAQEVMGLHGSTAIIENGVGEFNEQCRSMVSTYVQEWERTVTRMGRWVDFENGYKTMDKDFMETIWWVFKQLWNQDRIYKSYRIMPYSWRLSTPLSNFEANSNYKDVQDPAITIRVKLEDSESLGVDGSLFALLWTTTPWTLPENLAICVGSKLDYLVVNDTKTGDNYILAESRLEAYYRNEEDFIIVKRIKGEDIVGVKYEPIFPYFADEENAFQILEDAFVSTEDGTGIVHLAPAYGEEDYRICRAVGIGIVDPLDDGCKFGSDVPEYEGLFCKDADKLIIRRLRDEGKLVKHDTIVHSYPYCDRTDTPLIYRAIDAWYVKVEDLRDDLESNNNDVHWVPEYVGEKRFGNWIRDAKDWNISRNRFWGSCLPIWINEEDSTDRICIGSIAELEELSGEKVTDLHKHFIDEIVIERDGKRYLRTPEVLDCWFESGAMPYAQNHFPFNEEMTLEDFFPADFIAEGLDQTRGWFYTLLILGTAVFKKSPYKNVIVNGLILAEDGQKMSKSKKNYPDPHFVLDSYGADSIRLFLLRSPVVRGENLKFTEEGVKDVLRSILIPLWNSYSFFVTYANVDGWEIGDDVVAPPANPTNPLDCWVLSSLMQMVEEVTQSMDSYNLQKAANRFEKFIDDLTNWYIRRSRRRFWKSSNDSDKTQAYQTLHYVLITFSQTAAPFIPFITENIYQNLRTATMPESVHLCEYPIMVEELRDPKLELQMDTTMTAVSLGRYLRTQQALRVRQPLQEVIIVSADESVRSELEAMADVIAEELNVKAVKIDANEEELVHLSAKANFKTLGRQLGRDMKEVATQVTQLSSQDIITIRDGGSVTVNYSNGTVDLTLNEMFIERNEKEGMTVANEGSITVALNTLITEELELEGLAREVVNKIQGMRRDLELEVANRISIKCGAEGKVAEAVSTYLDYIKAETLTDKLEIVEPTGVDIIELVAGYNCSLTIEKS